MLKVKDNFLINVIFHRHITAKKKKTYMPIIHTDLMGFKLEALLVMKDTD